MAERGNTTHGPNLDDQLKHETQGLVKGNHPTRAEEWREAETMDDGENDGEIAVQEVQPDYDPGIDPAQASDAADDGPLTETIEEKVSNDEEESK